MGRGGHGKFGVFVLKGRDRMARHLSARRDHCCQCVHYSAKIQGPFMSLAGNCGV